jgi:hypothetical protein
MVTYLDGSTDTLQVNVNPEIATVLARYPLPNNPTGAYGPRTYAAPSKVDTDADQFSIRIDQKLGAKGQFLGRFNYDNLTGPTTNPDQTLLDPTFGVQYVDRQRNVVFTYTRTVSPRFLWSSSLSVTRTTPSFPTQNYLQRKVLLLVHKNNVIRHRPRGSESFNDLIEHDIAATRRSSGQRYSAH